jgi:outer membrane immunogenic protein
MTISTFMKRAATAGAMALAVAVPAKADWGGLYIGASIGWQSNDTDWAWVAQPNPNEPNTHDSGIYGGHIGIQHQWGQIVVGLEATYNGTVRLDDNYGSHTCNVNANFTCDTRLDTMFTIGPRLGWAPNHQWLIYVTGGYAHAKIDTQNLTIPGGVQFEKTAEHHDGWFIGGGVEFKLHGNWILGVEYIHVGLDSELHINNQFISDNRHIDGDIDIVRARLSYKWGRPEVAPLK